MAEKACDPVLKVEDVRFDYTHGAQRTPVLDGLTLHVNPGEWVAVMGASGSGKSTLLQCASGLTKPSSGAVLLDGVSVQTASDAQLTDMRRDRVGFVYQDFNLVAALTAADNVGLPARFGGRRRSADRVVAALERVGLGDKGRRRPDELSGGERQRVAIARALFAKPRLVFADEPTGALDFRSRDLVLDLFTELSTQGAGLLMVTHDPLVAARADRVLWLARGKIVEEISGATAGEIAARLAELELDVR